MGLPLPITQILQLLGGLAAICDFPQKITCNCQHGKIPDYHDAVAQNIGLGHYRLDLGAQVDLVTKEEEVLQQAEDRPCSRQETHFVTGLQLVLDVPDSVQHYADQKQEQPVNGVEHQSVQN